MSFRSILVTSLMFASTTVMAYTFDSDVPAEIQEQTHQDLNFMSGIVGTGQTQLHQQIFGSMGGSGYKNFFETRVHAVGMSDCGDANAVACVIPFYSSSKIWFTQNYIKFSHPQVARLMIVYHETRHTESQNRNWFHATCPTPFLDDQGREKKSIWTGARLAGKPACDVTPFGSYGSSVILLKNVQKFCSNCNEKVRMDAGIYGDDQFGRIIDAHAREQMTNDLYSVLN